MRRGNVGDEQPIERTTTEIVGGFQQTDEGQLSFLGAHPHSDGVADLQAITLGDNSAEQRAVGLDQERRQIGSRATGLIARPKITPKGRFGKWINPQQTHGLRVKFGRGNITFDHRCTLTVA